MQITLKDLVKTYGKQTAVKGLNLTIEKGALHFLLGPSGCGKTTTLRMLAGLEKPSGGQIFFGAEDVTKLPAMKRGIGMVFQNYALWPHMTVEENVAYGLKIRKLSKEAIRAKVSDVLNLTQLSAYEKRHPGELSGGQQQRVALARALAIEPRLLLLDEPLSNLDAKLRLEMRDNIARIHQNTAITTVYVTHDQKEALSMGTAVSVLKSGLLIQNGTPRKLYNHPLNAFIANFVGETNLIDAEVLKTGPQGIEVKTGWGIWHCPPCQHGKSFPVGTKVKVSLRPEHIELLEEASSTEYQEFSAKVLHESYLGDCEQLNLAHLESSLQLKANLFHNRADDIHAGQLLKLKFRPRDLRVLTFEDD